MAVAAYSTGELTTDGSVATPSIELDSLSFSYGKREARLVDISFAVDRGEFCSLLGPNGAGKTTLLRLLLHLLEPEHGTIRILGRDANALSNRERASLLAYVPQTTTTPFPFTALQMAVMGRTPHIGLASTPSDGDREIALTQLERLGIARLAHRPFSSLSGGEQQLTLLARALAQEAPVLILDEPKADPSS
jgi:iron complex transport system ATP-binding protein